MSTYDYLLEEGRKEGHKEGLVDAVTMLLRSAHEQGMDIAKLLNQDYGCPASSYEPLLIKFSGDSNATITSLSS